MTFIKDKPLQVHSGINRYQHLAQYFIRQNHKMTPKSEVYLIIGDQSCEQSCFAAGCRCGSNNSAMFADIVPEHLRSTVYAFDRSFEGAVAACAAPLVGKLPHL